MPGSMPATAPKRSGYLNAMRSEPMPPIEMPVIMVPRWSERTCQVERRWSRNGPTRNVSHFSLPSRKSM